MLADKKKRIESLQLNLEIYLLNYCSVYYKSNIKQNLQNGTPRKIISRGQLRELLV